MRNLLKRQRKNEEGSVLLAVLTIMTFATLLTATAFSFVRTASQRSYENINEKQAYYTASTCLETFIDSVLTPNNSNWEDFLVVAQSGGESDPIEIEGMGECVIKVEQPAGASYIKVMSTATVNDREETVVCYLRAITEPSDATFKNAIELTGNTNSAYDNLKVMGDVAGSNDTNSDMVYKFANESQIYGRYFQYGTIESTNHIYFYESVSGEGCSLTASKYVYFAVNDVTITSAIKKQNNSNSNYICAGNTFATANTRTTVGQPSSVIDTDTGVKAGDVDLFASGIVFGIHVPSATYTTFSREVANEFARLSTESSFEISDVDMPYYTQYGNVYCFAMGGTNTPGETDAALAGNLVCDNKAQVTITGDVYVEGNLYIAPAAVLKIYGNLYVKGDIIGTPYVYEDTLRTNTGKIFCTSYAAKREGVDEDLDNTVFESAKSVRGASPSPEYQGTKFLYYAEDLLISDNEDVSTISDKYKAVVTNPDSYKVSRFSGGTYDGVKFDLIITDSCYIGQYDLQNYSNILVNVKTDDIIIVFADGTNLNNGKKILVKNETKAFEGDDTLKPKFCYFTVDTYTDEAKVEPVFKTDDAGNIVYDKKGRKTIIDSKHEGFVKGATLNMDNLCIGDFDTWKNAAVGYQVSGVNCGTKPLNLTGEDINGTYNPGYGYIIMLLTEDTYIYAQNACQLEMTVFGREAFISYSATAPAVTYETGNSSVSKETTKPTFAIGSLVVGQLDIANTSWVAYCPPSSSSNLSNLGGSGEDKVLGYEVLKYTQDQS